MSPALMLTLMRAGLVALLLAALAWGLYAWRQAAWEEGHRTGAAEITALWNAESMEEARIAREDAEAATKAANEAKEREITLRAAADRARTQSERLSVALKDANARLATAPLHAVRQYATTATTVFDNCQRAYRELAAAADGHASDSLMYQQAWPKGAAP